MTYLLTSFWPDLSPGITLRYKVWSLFLVVLCSVKIWLKEQYWGQLAVCATAAKVEGP